MSNEPPANERGSASSVYALHDRIEVFWKGAWYPATVTVASAGSYRINYDGYDATWDETVDPTRTRTRRAAAPAAAGSSVASIITRPTATWPEVVTSSEACRTEFQSGKGSNDCILLVSLYDFGENRTGPLITLMGTLCPKVNGPDKKKQLVLEVAVDLVRLYWIKHGHPLPAGNIDNASLTTALSNVPPTDPLFTACGLSASG